VPLLVNHFLKAIVEQEGTVKSFSAEALALAAVTTGRATCANCATWCSAAM
jgi:hypothetical protein